MKATNWAGSVLVIGVTAASSAYADDFTISGAATTTNNGETVDGNDRLTVTASGSVTTVGQIALYSSGVSDILINNGALSTSGNNSAGMEADGANSALSNNGNITTLGDYSFGQLVDAANSSINNTGTVATSGDHADGLLSRASNNSMNNTGVITTTGENADGIYAQGGTENILNNSGTITTTRDHSVGILADSGSNTLLNSGIVTTSGFFGDGLLSFGNGNTLINSGTVTTNGNSSFGLVAQGDFNDLNNSGMVTTNRDNSFGLATLGNTNTVTNSGTVTTNGSSFGLGLHAIGNNNTLINSGTVTTSGVSSWAFSVTGDSNIMINTGILQTNGQFGHGFVVFNNANTLINSGTVVTNGPVGWGLASDGNTNIIINSGTVISNQSSSIYMSGAGATVNLLEGSVLYGDVNFVIATSATLNFGAGLNASVNTNNTIPNTITVANGSYVVAGSTIHAVDANSFAASDQTTGVMGGMILDTLNKQVAGNPIGVTRGTSASNTGWVEVFGGQRRHDGNSTTMAFTSDTYGVMAGRSLDATSGLFVGAARNNTASDRTFDNRSDNVFAGYYSRYDLGGIEMDASLTVGAAQNNTSRRIANNTVITGLETARGEYMSYFLMPSATFRGDWGLGDTGFETSVRVRYAAMHDQGYSETGSTAAMTVDGRTSHLGEVRLQVDGALIDQATASGSFTADLRVGADAQYLEGDRVSGSVAGQSIAFATTGDKMSSRAFAGLNMSQIMAHGTRELRGGFEVGRTQSGIADVSASIRWQMRF
jgi:hypothetical protein